MMVVVGHVKGAAVHLLHAEDHVLAIVVVAAVLPLRVEEDVRGHVKIVFLKNTNQRRKKAEKV